MRIALSLVLSLSCLGLGGCGQKGPLYLPTDPPPSQRAPARDDAPATTGKTAPASEKSTANPSQ